MSNLEEQIEDDKVMQNCRERALALKELQSNEAFKKLIMDYYLDEYPKQLSTHLTTDFNPELASSLMGEYRAISEFRSFLATIEAMDPDAPTLEDLENELESDADDADVIDIEAEDKG